MPITVLDPVPALVVIDLQKGIVANPALAHPAADICARAGKLAKAFRACGLPVVLVNVEGAPPGRTDANRRFAPGPGFSDFVPELQQQASDHVVTKHQWGAFHGTTLDHNLRRGGVTQVVLAGISTSIGVESTARGAHELGYNVVLITDAMTDSVAESHQHSVEKIFPRLGESGTTDFLLGLLEARAAT